MLAGVARYFLPLFSVVSHSISILQYVYPVVFILGCTEIRIFGLDFLESWPGLNCERRALLSVQFSV